MPPVVARAGAPLLLAALLGGVVSGCSEEPPIPTAPRPVVSSPNAPSVSSALPERPDRAVPQLVNVTFVDGVLTGDVGTVPVRLGSLMRLTVVSDVADVVLVEGYGQSIRTAIDRAVQIEVLADMAGSFDVRLTESGMQLTTLVVR